MGLAKIVDHRAAPLFVPRERRTSLTLTLKEYFDMCYVRHVQANESHVNLIDKGEGTEYSVSISASCILLYPSANTKRVSRHASSLIGSRVRSEASCTFGGTGITMT